MTYRVGEYLRLSRDDERDGESLSIENQRAILTNYVREQGWELVDTYIDDGFTGTNFFVFHPRPEIPLWTVPEFFLHGRIQGQNHLYAPVPVVDKHCLVTST